MSEENGKGSISQGQGPTLAEGLSLSTSERGRKLKQRATEWSEIFSGLERVREAQRREQRKIEEMFAGVARDLRDCLDWF